MVLVWKLGPERVMTNLRVVNPQKRKEFEMAIEKATGVKRG
jgi:hypothetical protein